MINDESNSNEPQSPSETTSVAVSVGAGDSESRLGLFASSLNTNTDSLADVEQERQTTEPSGESHLNTAQPTTQASSFIDVFQSTPPPPPECKPTEQLYIIGSDVDATPRTTHSLIAGKEDGTQDAFYRQHLKVSKSQSGPLSTKITPSSLLDMFQPPTPTSDNHEPNRGDQVPFQINQNGSNEQTALLPKHEKCEPIKWPQISIIPENFAPPDTSLTMKDRFRRVRTEVCKPSTLTGAVVFLFYHTVYCLTMASTIIRPQSDTPILGNMAKITSIGVIFGSPLFVWRLGSDIPAMYPGCDLFLAPFLARAAVIVDNVLAQEKEDYPDAVFFASFTATASIGMAMSGALLLLAAKFKLANLGTFLPYSVLCGFFSAVSVLLWALAFTVDTNGKSWQSVLFSGDAHLIWHSCLHHAPSLAMGITMKFLGPKHPLYIIALVFCTIMMFYIVMWVSGTTLEQAQEAEWFWSRADLVCDNRPMASFDSWTTSPAPFSVVFSIFRRTIHWGAVFKGLPNMVAMAFIYLMRCSIQASAMKKNIVNLVRRVPANEHIKGGKYVLNIIADTVRSLGTPSPSTRQPKRIRTFSDAVDIENLPGDNASPKKVQGYKTKEIRPKIPRTTLQEILYQFGYNLFVMALAGGFGITPALATSGVMYEMGADGVAPQYGSVLLFVVFYLTDFRIVGFIPKTAFSSLLVLSSAQTCDLWFLQSFHKTKELFEWLVVPCIVVFSLVVGFLNAILLGIGISTFVFVGSFFQVGVVKFSATGLTIRSTIERNITHANWLDEHGDLIQVLVLQTYLFFGNASSVLSFVTTMFDEPNEEEKRKLDFCLPPTPRVLIIDTSLLTGMDTSTVDIFADIKRACATHECKLFLSGLSPRLRSVLALGGVKPEPGERSKRILRMFPDLDTALGKAEDLLASELEVQDDGLERQRPRCLGKGEDGFRYALQQIDDQHGGDFALDLLELHPYTAPIDLGPGDYLFQCDGGLVVDDDRGLFFIESGMMKIERDANESTTRGSSSTFLRRSRSTHSLYHMHARIGSIGRQTAALKNRNQGRTIQQNFRLARIGPGWVCGTIEGATGLPNRGIHIAVSHCRLHHLPFSRIEELERDNPILVLRLYKMISRLMAKKQENVIEQLATLHSIMSSPANSQPFGSAASILQK